MGLLAAAMTLGATVLIVDDSDAVREKTRAALALLPICDNVLEAKLVAEKLRAEVERNVTVGAGSANQRQVTISLGVAHAPTTPGVSSASDFISRADEALYRSKERGRNRVTVAGE